MPAIEDALVYAVTYINLRPSDEEVEDEDVGALESIAGFLAHATETEKDALAAAAEKALAEERSGPKRAEFIETYTTWMEDLYGEGWSGNNRTGPID
jgi:hypothetical protein